MKWITFVLALALTLSTAASAAEKPNILWLIAEDFGQHLGCCGTKEVWTPNIDKLASDGVLYTRFYNGMVCSVIRSSFMTGMNATHSLLWDCPGTVPLSFSDEQQQSAVRLSIADIRKRLGNHTVLIAVRWNCKRPVQEGWQAFTVAKMADPAHIAFKSRIIVAWGFFQA